MVKTKTASSSHSLNRNVRLRNDLIEAIDNQLHRWSIKFQRRCAELITTTATTIHLHHQCGNCFICWINVFHHFFLANYLFIIQYCREKVKHLIACMTNIFINPLRIRRNLQTTSHLEWYPTQTYSNFRIYILDITRIILYH